MIHRSTTPDFTDGDALDATTSTGYTDATPVSGVTNYYKIVAIDSQTSEQLGVSSIMSFAAQTSGDQTSTTPPADNTGGDTTVDAPPEQQKPAVSSNISLNGSSNSGSVSLSWNAPGNGSYQYYVFRDGAQIGKENIITGTSYTDSTAEAGAAYSYMVICKDLATQEEVARSGNLSIQN